MKRILALCLLCFACTDEVKTRHTLEAEGFTDIEITGYDAWSCSDSDGTATGFRAKNVNGKVVTGTVCCGYVFKGCTIRY